MSSGWLAGIPQYESMRKQQYVFTAALLALVPFVYSADEDPYRAWEVVGVGAIALLLAGVLSFKMRFQADHLLVIAYCVLLVAQPLLIPGFSLWFGFQYAIVMLAAFVPAWIIVGIRWRPLDFEAGVDIGMRLIAIVIVLNIVGGRLLAFGESYVSELNQGGRSFGFLGDSISPVIIFPMIYFAVQGRLLWAAVLVIALVLTGGKTAMLMAMLVLPLLLLTRGPRFVQIASMLAMFFIGFLVYPAMESFVAQLIRDDTVAYSWNTREISYRVGWQYFIENPWVGVGINQSMQDIKLDADEVAYFDGITRYFNVYQIHNPYVRALAETGVFGFGILVGFSVVWSLRSLSSLHVLRARRGAEAPRLRALVLASSLWPILFITTYQTTGWFEHGHPQLAWLLIVNALGVASTRLLRNVGPDTPRPRSRKRPARSFTAEPSLGGYVRESLRRDAEPMAPRK